MAIARLSAEDEDFIYRHKKEVMFSDAQRTMMEEYVSIDIEKDAIEYALQPDSLQTFIKFCLDSAHRSSAMAKSSFDKLRFDLEYDDRPDELVIGIAREAALSAVACWSAISDILQHAANEKKIVP